MIPFRVFVAGLALVGLAGCASSPSPNASGSSAPAATSQSGSGADACLNGIKVSDGVGKFLGVVPTGGVTQKQFDDTFNSPEAEALAPQLRPSFDKMKAVATTIVGADQLTAVHKVVDLAKLNEEFTQALTTTCK